MPNNSEREDVRDDAIGAKLIELLALRVDHEGRVDTEWGDKTPRGLARTVRRVLEEGEAKSQS